MLSGDISRPVSGGHFSDEVATRILIVQMVDEGRDHVEHWEGIRKQLRMVGQLFGGNIVQVTKFLYKAGILTE